MCFPLWTHGRYVGAYTVKVTQVGAGIDSVGGYLGSELKDRGDRIAFLGDAHVTQASALAAFGNFEMLERSNNYTKNIREWLLVLPVITTAFSPLVAAANSIQPYWVMWVLSVLDLYDATGSNKMLLELQPWIEQRLDHALEVAAPTGTLGWSRDDDRMGFGFESPDRPEAFRAFLALLVGASRRYASAIDALGNTTASTKYTALSDNITARCRTSPSWFEEWGMHASADAITAGLVTPAEVAAMLSDKGAFGDPLQLPSLSIFETYFVLQAFGKINATTQAVYLIKRHYTGMLELGATTTWERFDPQWTDAGCLQHESPPVNAMNSDTSMAHPWAAGATAWLTSYGLGVRATAPGFARWVAIPTLLDDNLRTYLQGTVPTPEGPIQLEVNVSRGILIVDVPQNTIADLIGLPRFSSGLRRVWSRSTGIELFSNNSNSASVHIDENYVYLVNVSSGHHEYAYEMATRVQQQPQSGKWDPSNTSFNFAARFIGTDSKTSGAWRGKYGSKGFKLFAAGQSGSDVTQLPEFINDVYAPSKVPPQGGPPFPDPSTSSCKVAKGRNCCWQWNIPTNDSRVLENPKSSESRVLGALTSHGWASFFIEVNAADDTPYNVSLFMLDADQRYIRQALKVRDGKTLRTIAPMILVQDFATTGVYVTYEYAGSMWIRFNEVPSSIGNSGGFPPRPVLSGVFFD